MRCLVVTEMRARAKLQNSELKLQCWCYTALSIQALLTHLYVLISSNLPQVMRYFEEMEMKRIRQWAWCNSMHDFLLCDVFGSESEASDLTSDKSPCAVASERITEPAAGAKSIFIGVQLMSLQLLTKGLCFGAHQMWGCFSLWANTSTSELAYGTLDGHKEPISMFVSERERGREVTLATAAWRQIRQHHGHAHTLILFWQGVWHSLTLISYPYRKWQQIEVFDELCLLAW